MNKKKLIKLGIVGAITLVMFILAIVGIRSIKVEDFHPASVIFILDSSASNQKYLPKQIKYLKQLCAILDPEDKIKIIKVSQSAYIIYEGSPYNYGEIADSIKDYTKYNPNEYGTDYREAFKKAFFYSKIMKKEGYTPSVVVLGDLEDEGSSASKINWNRLTFDIEKTQKIAPQFSMVFLYAHPEKLDFVKEKLVSILGEDKLVIASGETIGKVANNILKAIGR